MTTPTSTTSELSTKVPELPSVTYPYRVSASPGDFDFVLRRGAAPSITVELTKQWGRYSRRCKYPALGQAVRAAVTEAALQLFPSLLCDGKLVLDAARAEEGYRMTWVEQTRGLDVRAAHGYLIYGYLIEGDYPAAMKIATRRRKRDVATRLA